VLHLASSGSAGKTTALRAFAREQVDLRVVPERNRSSASGVLKVHSQVVEFDQLFGAALVLACHSIEWNDDTPLLHACSAEFVDDVVDMK
jgi:hypothetical protein